MITKQDLINFENKVAVAFKAAKINTPIHLSGGNEDQLIDIFRRVQPEDYILSTHRSHYHYLLKGGDPKKLWDEILGLPTGCCGGKGRSMHIYDHELHFYTSAIVGGICAIACGLGLAGKRTFCFVGDGAEDSGFFFEAVRYCWSMNLPVLFIVENNKRAVETTPDERWGRYFPVDMPNIIRYTYERTWPHVGIGEHVTL